MKSLTFHGSWVAASFFRDHLIAVIVTPEGTWNLGPKGKPADRSGTYCPIQRKKTESRTAPPRLLNP